MDIFLVVIFDKDVSLLLCRSSLENVFVFREKTFIDTGIDTFVGFYDWLRTESEVVIGVRIDFFSNDFDNLKTELLKLPYVINSTEADAIDIFFTSDTEVDLKKSDDQDFLDNRIYKSSEGIYAISFDARYAIESLRVNSHLTLNELK